MHDDAPDDVVEPRPASGDRVRPAWLALVLLYWVMQVLYLLSPVDIIPDLVPVVGLGDDLLGLLSAFGFTGFGLYKAFGGRLPQLPRRTEQPRLPGAVEERHPGFEPYVPRTDHPDYEPLTPDELKAL